MNFLCAILMFQLGCNHAFKAFRRLSTMSIDLKHEQRIRKTFKSKPRDNIGNVKSVERGNAGNDVRRLLFPDKPVALSGLPDLSVPFTVLGIETSCDDTGVAVVRSDGQILGEAIASQQSIHEVWGGVVPGLARDAHVNEIERVVSEALFRAGMSSAADVDAIAVTVGPGLEICLRVGCEKAKALAKSFNKPFVAIHHLEAHVMLARAPISMKDVPRVDTEPAQFPFLSLLVSGGHCQMLLCEGVGRYKVLGGTLDDALGEAFDKIARLLGLPIGGGGGPYVEKCAKNGNPQSIPLPVPMSHKKDMNFSFAGLKNSFRMALDTYRNENGMNSDDKLPDQVVSDFAASFQNVAFIHLEQRLNRAMSYCESIEVSTLTVVGGVASNKELRNRIGKLCESREMPWKVVVPPPRLCTDNGVMIAWSGIEKLKLGISNTIDNQEVFPRVALGPFASEVLIQIK